MRVRRVWFVPAASTLASPPVAEIAESGAFRRAAVLGIAGLAGLLALGCSARLPVEQPIAYVHEIHVAEEEIPCTDCHEGAEDSDHATIPSGDVCEDCHEEAIGDNPEEAKLVAFLEKGEPIPWKRVDKLEEYVHFSHRRHVKAGKILCETCHGEVAKREVPFSRPYIDFNGPSGMERCISCHLKSGNPRAGVDCLLCHR
ncbi:MAG: cytochrome c3 family protein [Myxococcota bacterium]